MKELTEAREGMSLFEILDFVKNEERLREIESSRQRLSFEEIFFLERLEDGKERE